MTDYLTIAEEVLAKTLVENGLQAKQEALRIMTQEMGLEKDTSREAIEAAYAEYMRAYDS